MFGFPFSKSPRFDIGAESRLRQFTEYANTKGMGVCICTYIHPLGRGSSTRTELGGDVASALNMENHSEYDWRRHAVEKRGYKAVGTPLTFIEFIGLPKEVEAA